MRVGLVLIFIVLSSIFFLSYASADQWVNPKEVIGDPWIARLQYGRQELPEVEKEEIKRYGYTGLEIMTYLQVNREPGRDWEAFERIIHKGLGGVISMIEWLMKKKYCYKSFRSLLTLDGINPGDVKSKWWGIYTYPPKLKRLSWSSFLIFSTPQKRCKPQEEQMYDNVLRRNRRWVCTAKEDGYAGSVVTMDDYYWRELWEETHRILGEDIFKGHECFVIESKNSRDSKYYLSKRVVWVEKNNFRNMHEEHFDRKARLYKVIDMKWEQTKPWNYWVSTEWNFLNLISQERTLIQRYDWVFDMGLRDGEFLPDALRTEHIWKMPKNPPPLIKKASDFPPGPKVKWDFWDRIGVKPIVAK